MGKTIIEFLEDNFEELDGVTDIPKEDNSVADIWDYDGQHKLFTLSYTGENLVVTKWDDRNINPLSMHEYINPTKEKMIEIIQDLVDENNNELEVLLNFGGALEELQNGRKLTRLGWNGGHMFVVYQKGYPEGIPSNKQTADAWGHEEGDLFKVEPYLQIKTSRETHAMWVPSIGDILAEDWKVIG